jgi:hypothetical protein
MVCLTVATACSVVKLFSLLFVFKDFQEIWAAYDVDGDGTVSAAECFDMLSR